MPGPSKQATRCHVVGDTHLNSRAAPGDAAVSPSCAPSHAPWQAPPGALLPCVLRDECMSCLGGSSLLDGRRVGEIRPWPARNVLGLSFARTWALMGRRWTLFDMLSALRPSPTRRIGSGQLRSRKNGVPSSESPCSSEHPADQASGRPWATPNLDILQGRPHKHTQPGGRREAA